jgi:hypothetical protein
MEGGSCRTRRGDAGGPRHDAPFLRGADSYLDCNGLRGLLPGFHKLAAGGKVTLCALTQLPLLLHTHARVMDMDCSPNLLLGAPIVRRVPTLVLMWHMRFHP